MDALHRIIGRWYIAAVVLAVFALSFFSWLTFARQAKGVFSQADVSGGEKDGLEAFICAADAVVDAADSGWSVYHSGELSKIDAFATYYATREISSAQVARGKDDWLFYKSTTDGDPIADFECTNVFAEQDMEAIVDGALATQEALADRGIEFQLFVPPNKENVYAEYMPEIYTQGQVSRTDRLVERLLDSGVHIVSPKSALLDLHSEYELYYRYDTHWNQLGAYVGVREALAPWGIALPDLSARTVTAKPLKDGYHISAQDDLANLAGFRGIFDDDIEYEVDGTLLPDWDAVGADETNGQPSHYTNENAEKTATLLLIGDSFRVSMIPALREAFSDVYVVFYYNYTPELLDTIAPDYLLMEYVERYSPNMGGLRSLLG